MNRKKDVDYEKIAPATKFVKKYRSSKRKLLL